MLLGESQPCSLSSPESYRTQNQVPVSGMYVQIKALWSRSINETVNMTLWWKIWAMVSLFLFSTILKMLQRNWEVTGKFLNLFSLMELLWLCHCKSCDTGLQTWWAVWRAKHRRRSWGPLGWFVQLRRGWGKAS